MNKSIWITVLILAFAGALSVVAGMSQDKPKFPNIVSIKQGLSEPVPHGTCKTDDDRAGYLFHSDGETVAGYMAGGLHEQDRPTKEQIGEFVSAKAAAGFVVALYPQSNGWMFVDTQCSPGLESLLEKPK